MSRDQYSEYQTKFFTQYTENKDRFEVLSTSKVTIQISNTIFTAVFYKLPSMIEDHFKIDSSARSINSIPIFKCPVNLQSADQVGFSIEEIDLEAIQLLFNEIISRSIQMKFVD